MADAVGPRLPSKVAGLTAPSGNSFGSRRGRELQPDFVTTHEPGRERRVVARVNRFARPLHARLPQGLLQLGEVGVVVGIRPGAGVADDSYTHGLDLPEDDPLVDGLRRGIHGHAPR